MVHHSECCSSSASSSISNTSTSSAESSQCQSPFADPFISSYCKRRWYSLKCDVSAKRIDIHWTPPPDVPSDIFYSYNIEVSNAKKKESIEVDGHQTSYSICTEPGTSFDICLQCVESETGQILAEQIKRNVKAVFSMEQMSLLYQKALNSIPVHFQPFRYLYRCKPHSYWNNIFCNTRGIMVKYLKDNNGQTGNPINGAISGLFFNARTEQDGTLPPTSPFGNWRLVLPAPALLHPDRHSLYFADYYCNYQTHYVTIVICRRNSDTDSYCTRKLKRLNPETNPFLRIECHPPSTVHPDGATCYFVNKKVRVEIYFTESVPIRHTQLDLIVATGAGSSRSGGLPNNKHCLQCNLFPIKEGVKSPVKEQNSESEFSWDLHNY